MKEKINLAEKLALFSDYWSPRTVARLNEYDIMVVKVQGDFVWHKHDNTDDFFLVLKGRRCACEIVMWFLGQGNCLLFLEALNIKPEQRKKRTCS